ncbi:MAG: hypothetical protein K8T89_06975 [Planctomycetes bacterium]|nr:hypothetical protein [Planctomycetota bacterium]
MDDDHVGYLDFDGKISRFQSARCEFNSGRLSIEATGPKVKLHLHGIPFSDAASIADLTGKTFGPTDEGIGGDPFAEGGVETNNMWLSFQSMECKCRSFDPEARRITVWLCADVEDYESGRTGSVDCTVKCSIEAERTSQELKRSFDENTPCPNCGRPLRSSQAKQCFNCGADWH